MRASSNAEWLNALQNDSLLSGCSSGDSRKLIILSMHRKIDTTEAIHEEGIVT